MLNNDRATSATTPTYHKGWFVNLKAQKGFL